MSSSLIDNLQSKVGESLGSSDWIVVSQEQIDEFGHATIDPDPMHIDPVWARKNSPFGTTVSFGFLTMSLLTALYHDVLRYDRSGGDGGHGLNYGFNRMRLVAPVPVGSRVRGNFHLLAIEPRSDSMSLMRLDVSIEIEGQNKPALVGEWLVMWVADEQ